LFLLVGPSRVGKDSIMKALLRIRSLRLRKLVTVTTRERRPHEVAGKTYRYVSEATFSQMVRAGRFFEWAPVRRHRFGTPREPLRSWLEAGHSVLQQIDVRGAAALRRIPGLKVVAIFILPGSIAELRHRLFKKSFTPEQQRIRWQETLAELRRQTEFDYRVVNAEGQLPRAVREVAEIIHAIR
jgi:guanylate kinase